MKPNPEWQDSRGRFNGRAGPGRPRGVPEFETAMRGLFRDHAVEFRNKAYEMLMAGDSKMWDVLMKHGMPEPPKQLEVGSDVEGSVTFSWKASDDDSD